MPIPQGQSGFPLKTALTVATVALVLTAWHARITQPPGLDWHGLASVPSLPFAHNPSAPATAGLPQSTTTAPGQTAPGRTAQVQPELPPDALLNDSAGSLDLFYAALGRLDAHNGRATVVHFGDSPTTADLITGDVRQQLQQRFGDAGPGFNLIAKPWAWYQHRDIDETDKGWKYATAVGFMREGPYGIGGVSFDGATGSTTRYKLSGASPSDLQLIWKPGPGLVTIAADGTNVTSIDTSVEHPNTPGDTDNQSAQHFRTVPLPPNAHTVELHVTQGNVRLYGVLFERDQLGLTYDSIGLNGASVTVLSRAIAKDMMKSGFAHLHPDLIVINYGTNEAGFAAYIGKQYEGELRTAIARVHQAAPAASILLMSPMDRGERGAGNAIATMQTIPQIVAIQRRVAADTGCAFFNTFEAMGGEGTMQRWYEGKPRLVGGDLIHPTPQGAKIIANSFVQQLEEGYSRYKARTNVKLITVAQSPAP